VGFRIEPALDIAASEFYENGSYKYKDKELSPDQQIEFVADMVEQHNLHIVEDPLEQNDFEGYARLTELVGGKTLVVGDDLYVTNKERLTKGIEMGATNAILIKPNQIGTLTDTRETVEMAKRHGFETVISHRSAETPDDTIAHLGVAFGSYAIKTGAVGGERIAKLNELIRIEEDMEV
jgi:enolase